MKPLSERDEAVLSAITEIAREVEPEALDETAASRMVRSAAMGSRARGRWRREIGIAAVAAVAAAVVTLFVTRGWTVDESEAAPAAATDREESPAATAAEDAVIAEAAHAVGEPMELELPSGDRITAVEGSRFELLSVTEGDRRVALSRGSMLFDVAHLGEGKRFEVVTDDVRVQVFGTVFSVRATDEETTVRVYEGRVQVVDGDEERGLGAGEALSTTGDDADADDPRLSMRGERSAEERHASAASEEEAQAAAPEPAHGAAPPPVGEALDGPLPTFAAARGLIASGDPEGALVTARRVLAARPTDERFRLVEADALRALRRFAEAADAYDRVERPGAGFRAASIRFGDLSDPAGALASLDATSVDAAGSAFEERGLALRARALVALGRDDDARAVAERYVARFPEGTTRTFMATLLETAETR